MRRIEYFVNGNKTKNIVSAQVVSESDNELTVLINADPSMERKILKKKIISSMEM